MIQKPEKEKSDAKQDPNESMFMADVLENYELGIRRYSVVGNDTSFKAYTKNYSYLQGSAAGPQTRSIEESVLRVTLKDNLNKQLQGETDDGRRQYRVVHSDLMFVV